MTFRTQHCIIIFFGFQNFFSQKKKKKKKKGMRSNIVGDSSTVAIMNACKMD